MSFLLALKRKAHGKQYVSQLLNPNPTFSSLVLEALLWCAEYDGFPVTEDLVARAIEEGKKYPTLTINGYLEGLRNKALKDSLLGF